MFRVGASIFGSNSESGELSKVLILVHELLVVFHFTLAIVVVILCIIVSACG